MKKKDFTFHEKIKLCNDLGIFLSELNNINNANHIDKSIVNNLLNRLGQWHKDLKVRQYYYDV
mgnify:FL=1